MKTEVVVLGGGPAGAATALTLARAGVSTVLIEAAEKATWKVGEGLPPLARQALQRLGVWDRFAADGHLPSHGNSSAWGTQHLADRNFLFEPYGHGWHLDRQRFDTMLREAAVAAGARYCVARATSGGVAQVSNLPHTSEWRLQLDSYNEITARFVVDATGRASWFARKQGARRVNKDGLIGIAALLTPAAQNADRDSMTMIEAVAEGWWYAALLASGELVTVFLSDSDLPAAKAARTSAGWLELLSNTQHLARRVGTHGYRLSSEPRILTANSSRLDQIAGKQWFAVGDAAAAYDPLSSQGILAALESGERAGAALLAESNEMAIADYVSSIDEHWQRYLASLRYYYGQERRWPDAPFWQRRLMRYEDR